MSSHFRDATSVITGGTSGLGAAFARQLCEYGGEVVIVARNAKRLAEFADELRRRFPRSHVRTAAIDITNDDEVQAGLAKVVAESSKPVKALFNVAGVSDRAAILETTPEDFQRLWNLNFLGIVRCTRALAPELLRHDGHVVNIGSLASKVTSPFLGAYPASKFAVAAYSQQLRLELEPQGLHVLLVCPGPITRGDAGRRYDAKVGGLPESARKPGGGAKLKTIDPDALVRRVLDACKRREKELVLPGKVRWLAALAQLFPNWADRIILKKTTSSSG